MLIGATATEGVIRAGARAYDVLATDPNSEESDKQQCVLKAVGGSAVRKTAVVKPIYAHAQADTHPQKDTSVVYDLHARILMKEPQPLRTD